MTLTRLSMRVVWIRGPGAFAGLTEVGECLPSQPCLAFALGAAGPFLIAVAYRIHPWEA
jgi:hypothetical protein